MAAALTSGTSSDLQAALNRSSVLWVEAADGRLVAVWFARATDDEQLCFVISGAGEQSLPPLPERTTVILRRRDTRTPVGPVPAHAERVAPGDPRWDAATGALTSARQGVPTPELLAAWREDGAVWAIRVDTGEDEPGAG